MAFLSLANQREAIEFLVIRFMETHWRPLTSDRLAEQKNDLEGPDADSGANQLQNFPEITELVVPKGSNELELKATLASQPNKDYLVQTFVSTRSGFSGEAKQLVDSRVVTTGSDGIRQFTLRLPSPDPSKGVHYSMTATDESGNTSELSPSATAADFVFRPFEISVGDIEWEGQDIVWQHDVEVCNDGGRAADDVALSITDGAGNSLIAPENSTLDFLAGPGACHTVPLTWNITDELKVASGATTLSVTAEIDSADAIMELSEDNTLEVSRFLNVRPRFEADSIETEFKPGYFVAGISMNNEVAVENVDWNGDLPGKTNTGTTQKRLNFSAGSVQDSAVVTSSFAEVFEFDLGTELSVGANEIKVEALTMPQFDEATWIQTTHQLSIPAWLGGNVMNGKEEGDYGERIALYTQKVAFPGLVTEGFFGIPASENQSCKGRDWAFHRRL